MLHVQSFFRGYQDRSHCKELWRGITSLKSFIRRGKSRKEFATLPQRHKVVVIIQKHVKTIYQSKRMNDTIDAALIIQSSIRGWLVRRCSGDIGFLKPGGMKTNESDDFCGELSILSSKCITEFDLRKNNAPESYAVIKGRILVKIYVFYSLDTKCFNLSCIFVDYEKV